MFSILIPAYNYNIFPLVSSLHSQATTGGVPFEIIVLDDASSRVDLITENSVINTLFNCTYEVLPQNIGRSAIRNLLAERAKYDWLLYLDADTLPVNEHFISGYLPFLNDEEKIVYGGIKYPPERPESELLLRWIYGNEREALGPDMRDKAPHLSLLTLNFAIHKSIFKKVCFNEAIPNLRHEDTLFSYNLSEKNIPVEHIENPVFHLGLDTSKIFLQKSEESVVGLKYLLDNNLLPHNYIRLSHIYKKLLRAGLSGITGRLFKLSKSQLKKNLLSSNPSLFIFDLYRLGYLCSLK